MGQPWARCAPLLGRPSNIEPRCRSHYNGSGRQLVMGGVEIDLYFLKNFVFVWRVVPSACGTRVETNVVASHLGWRDHCQAVAVHSQMILYRDVSLHAL